MWSVVCSVGAMDDNHITTMHLCLEIFSRLLQEAYRYHYRTWHWNERRKIALISLFPDGLEKFGSAVIGRKEKVAQFTFPSGILVRSNFPIVFSLEEVVFFIGVIQIKGNLHPPCSLSHWGQIGGIPSDGRRPSLDAINHTTLASSGTPSVNWLWIVALLRYSPHNLVHANPKLPVRNPHFTVWMLTHYDAVQVQLAGSPRACSRVSQPLRCTCLPLYQTLRQSINQPSLSTQSITWHLTLLSSAADLIWFFWIELSSWDISSPP